MLKVLIFLGGLSITFFAGLLIGKERTKVTTNLVCVRGDKAPSVSITTVLENQPSCVTDIKHDKKERLMCPNNLPRNISTIKLGKAKVPETVFSFLHHPASPAKNNFFYSSSNHEWHNDDIIDSPCKEIYLTRTGSRASQPNKCVSVVKVHSGFEPMNQQSYRVGYTALNTNQYQKDYPRDYNNPNNEEYELLVPLLRDLPDLLLEFNKKMGESVDPKTQKRRRAIVMVANEGVIDLLLNFLCSAEAANINLKQMIVFVGDEKSVALIESLGVNAIYSASLGSMPKKAAASYLDHTFSRMMWFKATSVYLALSAGFDVLFQDVDLVWLKDPFQYLDSLDSDVVFMDDGARTPRYTPFFVNSGFYYVRHNPRSLYMFESMTKAAASEIGQTHSHQSVLIRHISEAHHLFGLKVFVLDTTLFPSGQAYHENKKLIRKIQSKEFQPFVFHMCWTDNRENKVVYFKDVGLWYLPESDDRPECSLAKHMQDFLHSNSMTITDRCCQRQLYWPQKAEETH